MTFTGALPHAQVPELLASADIGVAPFDVSAHPSLAHEFHWSPLKVFEYMASGLPVVAPRIPRLTEIIEDGREGVLYDASDEDGLARALEQLSDSPGRVELGMAARRRAVADFSWQTHCRHLDQALRAVRERGACAS